MFLVTFPTNGTRSAEMIKVTRNDNIVCIDLLYALIIESVYLLLNAISSFNSSIV